MGRLLRRLRAFITVINLPDGGPGCVQFLVQMKNDVHPASRCVPGHRHVHVCCETLPFVTCGFRVRGMCKNGDADPAVLVIGTPYRTAVTEIVFMQ